VAHSGLDGEDTDVLPAPLEEGDEEVDGTLDVGLDLLLSKRDVADSDTEAESLLHLELDLALELEDLGLHVVAVLDDSGELTSTVETGTEDLGDLTEDRVRGKEGVVLLGKTLVLLLVLADLLEVVDAHAGNAESLGLVEVNLVTKNANLDARTAGIGKTDNTRETLVLRLIPVLETNLELNGLSELALTTISHDLVDRLGKICRRNLGHVEVLQIKNSCCCCYSLIIPKSTRVLK